MAETGWFMWRNRVALVKGKEKVESVHIAWWSHQMEAFSALLALCAGNSPVTGEFPAQRPVMRSFDVFFDLGWINGWINNREAGDMRRHRAHYDVVVMNMDCLLPKVQRGIACCITMISYWKNITLNGRAICIIMSKLQTIALIILSWYNVITDSLLNKAYCSSPFN